MRNHLLIILSILLIIFASIGEGILSGLEGDSILSPAATSGIGSFLEKTGSKFKSALAPDDDSDEITTPKPSKRKNKGKSKKGKKSKKEKSSESTEEESSTSEETSLEDTISTSESVPSPSTTEMDTTTSTTPIPTTTDTLPPSSTTLTEQTSTRKSKKSKKRRKSKKSRRKYSTTTDLSTDVENRTSSSSEYSDEEDGTELPTTQPPSLSTSTISSETSSSTINSVTSSSMSSTTSTSEVSTSTTLETIPSDATTTTRVTTEVTPQVSSTTDVPGLNEKSSTISPSSSTTGAMSTGEPPGETTKTTEMPITSLSSPELFNSSLVESTTTKSDGDNASVEKTTKARIMSDRALIQPDTQNTNKKDEEQQVATQTESSDDKASQQCVATVPRLNLNLDMMLGEWYPARLSETTSKLWSQSLEKDNNSSVAGCFLMDYKLPEDDPDILEITLSRQKETANVEALFVGDDHHPRESKWAITWPNGEDTLTSVVAAGVILGSGGGGGGGKGKGEDGVDRGNSSSRYAWLLTVDCDLNGIVEPDWAVMARVREGISNATLSTILAIVEGLKGLRVDDAITFQSDDCHKNNNNNTK